MQTIPSLFIICDNNDLHVCGFYAKVLCHIYTQRIVKCGIIILSCKTYE